MNDNIIISLTSHGNRIKYVSRAIFSVINGTYKNVKIVLTLYKDDICNITNDLKILIDNNIVELIIADEDLGPNLKYYYSMKKYSDKLIITIDDDNIYSSDLVISLLNTHYKFPNCVCARRTHLICCDKNKNALDNSYFIQEYKRNLNPSKILYASGVGGVLYPNDFFNLAHIEDNKSLIYDIKYNDDIFLKVMEIKNNIQVVYAPNSQNHPKPIDKIEIKNEALCKTNDGRNGRNTIYFNKVKKYFDTLFND